MATTISAATFQSSFTWNLIQAANYGTLLNNNQFSPTSGALTHGTGAGCINKLYLAQGTIAGGATLTLDLNALTDPLGNAINFGKIKFVWFDLLTTTTPSSVTFAGTVSNSAFAWNVPVYSGGRISWIDFTGTGITVTNTTADQFTIVNNDGAVAATYRLALGGE